MAVRNDKSTPIGRKLRDLRGALTQAQAAERAGITKEAWQLIESGKTKTPAPKTLQGIARAFNEDPDVLANFVYLMPEAQRFTDEELDRLAVRLAPLLAERLTEIQERRQ